MATTIPTSSPPLPPQFVSIYGLTNFRDIGGWPIVSPTGTMGHVRKGVFYRGPDTAPILPVGEAKLRELGVTKHFDLRSKGQIVKAGGFREIERIERVWCPAFPDGEYSPEKAASRYVLYASDGTDGIVQAFTEILTHGAPALRTILQHLASLSPSAPTASFIHCTTGNNRSGVFIGIILSLLNVPAALIADEYSLSDIGLTPTRDQVVDRLMKSPVFANAGGGGRERAERMVGARRESMLAMLEMVERKWGGAEGYVRDACGLTAEEIEKVRGLMTVQVMEEPKRRLSRAFSGGKKNFAQFWVMSSSG